MAGFKTTAASPPRMADTYDDEPSRTTAPQSPFSKRQAAIGAAVTAVGLVVAYLVPGLLF